MAEGNSKKTVHTKSTNVHNEKADEGDTVKRDKRGDKETIDELPEDDIENLLNLNASDAPTPSTVSSSEGATTPPDGQASEVAEGDEDTIQDGGVLRNDSTDPDMSFEKCYDTTSNRNGFASEGAAGEDASPSNIAVEEERPAPKDIALSKDERRSLNASAVAGLGVGYPKASNEQPGVGAEKSLGSYLDCPSGVPYLPEQTASVFQVSQHQAPVLDKGGECSGRSKSLQHGSTETSVRGETPVAGGTAAASTKGDTLSVAGGTAAASTKGDTLSVAGGTAAACTKGDTLSVAGGTAAASTKGDTLSVAGDDDTPSTAGETVVATISELPMGPTNHHASFPTASAVTLTSTSVPCYDPAVMNTEPSLSGSNQRPIATPSVSASLPATPSPSMAFPELSYSSTNSDSGLGSVGLGSGSSTGQNSSPLSGPPSGSPEPNSSVLDATPMPSGHKSGIPGSAAMPGGSVVENKSGEDRLLGIATICDGRTHESAVRVAASLGLPELTADSLYLIRLMIQSDLLRQCPECVPQAFIARLPHVTLAFECTPSGSIYDRAASLSPSVPLGGPATVSTSRSPQALAAEAVNTPTGRSTFSIVTTTTSSSTCTTTTITTTTASVNATITTTTLSGLPGHTRVFHPQIGARVSSTIVLEDRENLPPQPASGGAFPWRRAPEHQAPIFVPSLGPLLLLRRVMVVVDDEPVADLQSYSVDLANDVVDPSDDRDLPVAGGGMNSLVCFVCLFDFVFALLHHHTL